MIVVAERVRRQAHLAKMRSRRADRHRHGHFFLRPRREGDFLVKTEFLVERDRDATRQWIAAEIADGNFQRHGVAGQHLRLRRPGVQNGVVVEPDWSDVHEKQFRRRRQH